MPFAEVSAQPAQILLLSVSEDSVGAAELVSRLRQHGLDVWPSNEIKVGDSHEQELNLRLMDASAIVVYASARAVGNRWLRRLCDATRTLARSEGRAQLIIAKMELLADADALNPGCEHADFSQNYELGMRRLCAALGRTPVQTYAALVESFVAGNEVRIRAHVGDKFRPNLYVSRELERHVLSFASDPRTLIDASKEVLAFALAGDTVSAKTRRRKQSILRNLQVLDVRERRVVERTCAAFDGHAGMLDEQVLRELKSAVLPPLYGDIESELAKYSDYIQSDPSQLTIRQLAAYHQQIEAQLKAAKATKEVLDALQATWSALTERRSGVGAGEPDGLAVRKLSLTSSATTESRDFATVRHRLDILHRAVASWGRSRIIAAREIPLKPGSTAKDFEALDLHRLLQQCEILFDAANKRCFLIIDMAGSGKTNMLSAISLKQAGAPTIALFCKAFSEGGNIIETALNEAIAADLHVPLEAHTFEKFLSEAHAELERAGKYVLVLIDGINEFSNDGALAESIRLTVAKYQNQRVRFVATCRDIYWQYFRDTLEGSAYKVTSGNLRRYSDYEYSLALSKYLQEYGLDHVRMDEAVQDAFRLPILLRFFCEAYGSRDGRRNPQAPGRVHNVHLKRLFDDYLSSKLQRLVQTGHAKIRYARLKEKRTIEEQMLRIASRLHEAKRPYLLREETRGALDGEDMDLRSSSYSLLLDEDIVLEERNGRVFFVYEAFMEYAIARALLRGVTAEKAASALSRMMNETAEFRNMRGVVLMALVMLAEERRLSFLTHVLRRGEEWVSVVLAAADQISVPRVDPDFVDALSIITDIGTSEQRKEALRLLLQRGGELGRAAVLQQLARGSARHRSDTVAVLESFGDAYLLRRLIADVGEGKEGAVDALIAVRPGRRGIDHLAQCLTHKQPTTVASVIRALAKVKAGELRRAAILVEPYIRDRRAVVAEAARHTLERLADRLNSSERRRREGIAASYVRAGARSKRTQARSNL